MDFAFEFNLGGTDTTPAPLLSGTVFNPPDGANSVVYTSYDASLGFTGIVESYTMIGTLPTGLTLDSLSGVLAGTPTSDGTFGGLQVTAANVTGSVNSAIADIFILAAPILSGTAFNPPDGVNAVVYVDYDTSVNFTGTVDSYALVGTLPTGLTLNTATGVIAGTPTAVGTFSNIQITATNAAGSVTTATADIVIT